VPHSNYLIAANVDYGVWCKIKEAAQNRGQPVSDLVRAGLQAIGIPIPDSRRNGRPRKHFPACPPEEVPVVHQPVHSARRRVRLVRNQGIASVSRGGVPLKSLET
jgi:hypothetical protein